MTKDIIKVFNTDKLSNITCDIIYKYNINDGELILCRESGNESLYCVNTNNDIGFIRPSLDGGQIPIPESLIPTIQKGWIDTAVAKWKDNKTSVIFNSKILTGFFVLPPVKDSEQITSCRELFYLIDNLKALDLKWFNTSNVTDMTNMFNGCSRLTSLDISGWDMTNVTTSSNMFDNCESLTTIKMIGCDQITIDKIKQALTEAEIISQVNIILI